MDAFTLQLPVLGPLRMAAVWLEGRACAWHLDLIVVTGPQGKYRACTAVGWARFVAHVMVLLHCTFHSCHYVDTKWLCAYCVTLKQHRWVW